MNEPLITVIVPVYNTEKYLDRCIKSIVDQTYKSLEILLIDDGSNDKSSEIIDLWSLKDSRIRVFHKKNSGASDSRNYGLNFSNGKYISFIDSDDYVDKTFIESLFDMVNRFDVKMSSVGCKEFYGDICNNYEKYVYEKVELLRTEKAIEYLFLSDKYRDYFCNKLFEKSLFLDVKFPVGKKMEDAGTTYLLIDKCTKVAYSPAKLYYYFQRDDSVEHIIDESYLIDEYDMVKQKYIYVKEKYPNLLINYSTFFIYCIKDVGYKKKSERKWAKKELKSIYPIVNYKLSLVTIIKYYLFEYLNIIVKKY